MASSRLPGFLRRSLRISYEEEDGDADDEEVGDDNGGDGSVLVAGGPNDETQNDSTAADRAPSRSEECRTDARTHPSDSSKQPSSQKSTQTAPITTANGATAPALVNPVSALPKETIHREQAPLSSSSKQQQQQPPLPASKSDGDANHDSWQIAAAAAPSNAPSLPNDPPPKPTWREVQFQRCLEADVVSLAELRKLAWNGIPNKRDRALAWKILLGYAPTNRQRRDPAIVRKRSEYLHTVAAQHYHANDDSRTAQEQETLRQVLVDVPRTAPDIPLFRHDRIKRMLSRLLYSWAMRHPASSYVQGINDLATPLIVVFLGSYFDGDDVLDGHVMHHLPDDKLDELEADVYWCLANLLSGIQDHYTADQPGVQRMVRRLEDLTHRIDAALCQHLSSEGVEFLQFSFKWMNCLLLREFHLRCIPRLWDTYLAEKSGFEDFHVYVCAAFLCQFSSDLQTMPFDGLFGFFQDMPTSAWTDTEVEMLLSQAYVLSTLFGGSEAHLANTNSPSSGGQFSI
jgi:TBC1 domain family member 2